MQSLQFKNTPRQNEHCLRNFDLAEYRGILSDLAIWLVHTIIKDCQKKLNPMIVPAMLEHESLPGISPVDRSGARSTAAAGGDSSSSLSSAGSGNGGRSSNSERFTIESLSKKLNEFLQMFNSHGVDPELVNQIFRQLFYFIASNTFNNLILRKELCCWSKGLELKYHISSLEQWIRDSRLQESGALETLEPIVQASHLLQARKTDSDIKSICEMCSKLTIAQIQRILFSYTPVDIYEEKLTRPFIDKVTTHLKELRHAELSEAQLTLTLDTQRQPVVSIPFNPSSIGLETIELPEQLGISFLKKL